MLWSFNPYIILLLVILITCVSLNYLVGIFVCALGLAGLSTDALLSGTGEVYDREQVPVSGKGEGSKKKLKKKFKMFKNWNPFRRKAEKSKENISSQCPKADRIYQNEDRYYMSKDGPKSATPSLTRQHRSFIVNRSQTRDSEVCNNNNNRSVLTASGPLLSTPLLPRVKRAVGANDTFSPAFSPSVRSGNRSIGRSSTFHYAPNHPTKSTPGTLPTVRLRKTHQRSFLDTSNSYVHSPNTVKIAPPDQSAIFSPRVLPLTEQQPVNQKPIDTQAVVCALRQRRKRSLVQTDENILSESDQLAKRRRQDSSQSTASSSSLPPMPENLPDLSNSNLMMHIDSVSMKRPSAPSRDPIEISSLNTDSPAKRARNENRNNPILSSLSSSKRALEKSVLVQKDALKRKPVGSISISEETDVQFLNSSDLTSEEVKSTESSMDAMDAKDEQFTKLQEKTEIKVTPSRNESRSDISTVTSSSQPLPDGIAKSVRKGRRSLYPSLVNSFKKVPVANVLASVEDYEQDRILEQQRVHDMLNEVEAAHKQKQNKGQVVTSTSDNLSTVTSSASSSAPPVSLGGLLASSTSSLATSAVTTSTSPPTGVVTSLTTAGTSSMPTTSASVTSPPQYSFKPVFGSTAASQVAATAATGLVSTPVSTTTTSQASGFSMVFPPPDSTAEKAPPPYQSNISSQRLSVPAASISTHAGLSTTLVSSTSAQGGLSATSAQGGLSATSAQGGLSAPGGLSGTYGQDGLSAQGGLSAMSAQGGLSATSVQGGLSGTYGQGSLPATSVQGGLSGIYGQGGLSATSAQGGLSATSAQGGLSAMSAQGGLSATSALGGLFSTSVQNSLSSTSVQKGITASLLAGPPLSTSGQGSFLSTSAQGSFPATSMHGGFLATSAQGSLPATSQTSLPSFSVPSDLTSKAGLTRQVGGASQAMPTFTVTDSRTTAAAALGVGGGFSFTASADKAVTNAAQSLFAASTPVTSAQATSSTVTSFFAAAAAAATATSSNAVSSSGSSLFVGAPQQNTANAGQGFAFGTDRENNVQPAGFNFGQPASTASGMFGLNEGQTAAKSGKDALKVNLFGASPAPSAAAPPSLFSFGQSQQSQTSMAPSQTSNSSVPMASSGFSFGAPLNAGANSNAQNKTSVDGGFAMPGQQPTAQPSQSTGFNFGAANAASGNTFGSFGSGGGTVSSSVTAAAGGPPVFSFGGTNSSQSSQNFGGSTFNFNASAAQVQKSDATAMSSAIFGASNQNAAFGSTQPKSSGTVFGSTATQGLVFGAPTTQSPMFGNATKQGPVFSATVTDPAMATAVFGSSGDKKPGGQSSGFNFGLSQPVFGGPTQTTGPVFGAPQAAPGFGAPQTTNAGFGTPQAQVPGFGSSQPPVQGFGTAASSSMGFGASPTPSQGFGATAKVPNFAGSVPNFGNAAVGQGAFQFGQSTSQTAENKGFNFNASTPPVFNFGSANANVPNQNLLFNVNTNSGVLPRSRVAARQRRRGQKK